MINWTKSLLSKLGILRHLRTRKFYIDLLYFIRKELRQQLQSDIRFYSQFIQKGELCFDVGANIGSKTYVFNRIGCKVIAIEPDKAAYIQICQKFNKSKNITILNVGVGEKHGKLELFKSKLSTLSTFDQEDLNYALIDVRFKDDLVIENKYTIDIFTVDELIKLYGTPNYLKIATVGYELHVLKGLTTAIKVISITCNLPYHIQKTVDCIHYIANLSAYEFNYFKSHHNNGFVLHEWCSSLELIRELRILEKEISCRYIEIYARIKKPSSF